MTAGVLAGVVDGVAAAAVVVVSFLAFFSGWVGVLQRKTKNYSKHIEQRTKHKLSYHAI